MFTFHLEANGKKHTRMDQTSRLTTATYQGDPHETIKMVRETGMKCGIAIKPKTPVEAVLPFAELVDMVCCCVLMIPGLTPPGPCARSS